MESALDTFGLMRRIFLKPQSLIINSEPDNDSLPWFEHEPCGERESFALGVGGTDDGRGINSVDDPTGKFSAFKFDVLCQMQNMKRKKTMKITIATILTATGCTRRNYYNCKKRRRIKKSLLVI